MPRFTKAASLAFAASIRDAYESGSHGPLSAFESLYGAQMPQWAVRTARDVRSNIDILVTQAQVELNSPFEGGMVPTGTIWATALYRYDRPGEPGMPDIVEFRSARVYTVLDMTYQDYLDAADLVANNWRIPESVEGVRTLPIPIWQIFPNKPMI